MLFSHRVKISQTIHCNIWILHILITCWMIKRSKILQFSCKIPGCRTHRSACFVLWGKCLRDWSRSGGSYGNNTRVICCPAPGRPESAARGTSPPDNKSRGCCCRNSLPTVINPDYNMTKQRCMKRIYDKIHPKSPPNLATSPTCLHRDVTHLSLTTGVVALHIPSWRIEVREERRQARKIVWPVNAGRVICRYQNNLCGIINHHKHIRYYFVDV